MRYLSTEETERSKVVLTEAFVDTNLAVESPAVPMTKQGEALLVFGASQGLQMFLRDVIGLLGKGDERYFWSGVRPLNDTQVVLSMLEKDPGKTLPRIELVQRLLILDLLRYSPVQVRQFCRLTVLTPSGSLIHTAQIETPRLEKAG